MSCMLFIQNYCIIRILSKHKKFTFLFFNKRDPLDIKNENKRKQKKTKYLKSNKIGY